MISSIYCENPKSKNYFQGSSIKCLRSDFVILDPSAPCTCRYIISLHRLSSSTIVRILVFKGDMTDTFCELLSIKEPRVTLQNKEATVQSYRKMSKQNTKKSPELEGVYFNCTGEIGMDNFGCLNSSLSLFYFYFVTSLQKKIVACVRLQLNLPLPHRSQYAFIWTTPPLFDSTYFMDGPLVLESISSIISLIS